MFAIKPLLLLFLFSLPIAGAWEKQNSGTLAWLHSVYFFDEQKGFVVGSNGTILTTRNGGSSWEKSQSPTHDALRDIVFLDRQNGWILAEKNEYLLKQGEPRSYLLRTTDGGATWSGASFPNNNFNSQLVRFVSDANRQQIWAVGALGTLYALSKNKATWQKQTSPTEHLIYSGAFLNEKQGWLAGAGGKVFSTADGGQSWREAIVAVNSKPRFYAAFFVSPQVGWLVGASGKIFATVNGATWREQPSATTADLRDVKFVSENEGWTVGDDNTLLHTTNGGLTWTQDTSVKNFNRRLERLFFVQTTAGQNRGWAVGFGGTILAR